VDECKPLPRIEVVFLKRKRDLQEAEVPQAVRHGVEAQISCLTVEQGLSSKVHFSAGT